MNFVEDIRVRIAPSLLDSITIFESVNPGFCQRQIGWRWHTRVPFFCIPSQSNQFSLFLNWENNSSHMSSLIKFQSCPVTQFLLLLFCLFSIELICVEGAGRGLRQGLGRGFGRLRRSQRHPTAAGRKCRSTFDWITVYWAKLKSHETN